MMMTTVMTAMMMVLTNDADLAEDLVEVSLVRKERDYHEDREQKERHNCFPEINFVLGIKRIWLKLSLPTLVYRAADHQDDHDPEVGEDGEEGGDDEDGEGLDPPDLVGRHPGDADSRDGKQVERGRPAVGEHQTLCQNQKSQITTNINKNNMYTDPTMVDGPNFSDSKLLPMIPITARRISGAEEPVQRWISTYDPWNCICYLLQGNP